jgi:hypothetical protein
MLGGRVGKLSTVQVVDNSTTVLVIGSTCTSRNSTKVNTIQVFCTDVSNVVLVLSTVL